MSNGRKRKVLQMLCASCGARLGWVQQRDSPEKIPLTLCDGCFQQRRQHLREVTPSEYHEVML